MSMAFAVLIILLLLAIFYFRRRQAARVAALLPTSAPQERPQPASGFDVPSGYCFHPGHTWIAEHGREARVGIDNFAANLLGKVEHITVIGEQRWVRQGQKLMTLSGESGTVEMLSPLEGVVTAVNPEVIKHPEVTLQDPYRGGWVCAIKSPEMETNRRNLMSSSLAASWMQNSVHRLKTMLAQVDPALAQDGGLPLPGVLSKLSPEMRQRLVNEFFLT